MAEFNVRAKATGKQIGEDGYFEMTSVVSAPTEAEARNRITQDDDLPAMQVVSCEVMGGD